MDVSAVVLTLRSKAYGNSVFSSSWKKSIVTGIWNVVRQSGEENISLKKEGDWEKLLILIHIKLNEIG